jgi:hypothetical protein
MAVEHLDFDDSIAGLLVDGDPDSPYVGGTLRMLRGRGVEVQVPYLSSHRSAQFASVDTWFSQQTPPKNMELYTPNGTLSLFDVTWGGHSENWGGVAASIGTLRPSEAVLRERDGDLAEPLEFRTLQSRLDGLSIWARAQAIMSDSTTDEEGRVQSVTYTLNGDELVAWDQGPLRMSLTSTWTTDPQTDGYAASNQLQDFVVLRSHVRDEGVVLPFWDHFVEHRKLATLLVFLFGRSISFREHHLQDERFAARMMGGTVYNHPFYEVVSRHTYRDREAPVPTKEALGRPLAYLPQIGAEGLAKWSEAYDAWNRFILPSSGVLGRTRPFIEDIVISTSMSIEAAGAILGRQAGEDELWNGRGRTPTKVNAYRCLQYLELPLEVLGDRVGLAIAIANNYNDVKHYDRGDFPEHGATFLVSRLNRLIVRLIALSLADANGALLLPYRNGSELHEIKQEIDGWKAHVDHDGNWSFQP